jgi:hypothetical protein
VTAPTIIRNRARCCSCNEIIESFRVWQALACRCGRLVVDGGLDYLVRRFEGDSSPYEELAVIEFDGKRYSGSLAPMVLARALHPSSHFHTEPGEIEEVPDPYADGDDGSPGWMPDGLG